MERVSIVGLGKLGLPFSLLWASYGLKVIGVEIDSSKLESLRKRKSYLEEPEVQEYLDNNKIYRHFEVTDDLEYALRRTDLTFIIVPTPSNDDGTFSIALVERVCRKIAAIFKDKSFKHPIIINSTVNPLDIDKKIKPIFSSIDIAYNPEFIAIGQVMKGFKYPDFVLIGESSKEIGDRLENMYKLITSAPICRTTIPNAELIKISINAYITMKISFINTLTNIAENLPTGDIDEISKIMSHDRRISPHFFKGGLGFGGPCFPRDNLSFYKNAQYLGVYSPLSLATDDVNNFQVERLYYMIKDIGKKRRVAILGITYKTNTDQVEQSQGIRLAQKLWSDVNIYDPKGIPNAKKKLGNLPKYFSTWKEAIKDADIIAIMVPWKEFEEIKPEDIKDDQVIIDCWRILDKDSFNKKNYIGFGLYNDR